MPDLRLVDPRRGDFRQRWDSPALDAGDPQAPQDFDLTNGDIGWTHKLPVTEISGTISTVLPVGHYLVTDDAEIVTPLEHGTVLKVASGKVLVLLPGPDPVLSLGDAEGTRTAIVGRPERLAPSCATIKLSANGHPDCLLRAEGVLFNYPASNGGFHGMAMNGFQSPDFDLSGKLISFQNYVNVPSGSQQNPNYDGRLVLEACTGQVSDLHVGSTALQGPGQLALVGSRMDVVSCTFRPTGTAQAADISPLTVHGLLGPGTPRLLDNLFHVDRPQTAPLADFRQTVVDLERNRFLDCRSTAIIETHSALYMDHEARNDLRAYLDGTTDNYPLVEMEGGDLDLFCGRNNFIVRGFGIPDWPIIRWTGDTHAAQVWRENFWGTGCSEPIPDEFVEDLIPAWATVEASLIQCVEALTPANPLCPFEPLTPYELLRNGLLAEAAEDYPLARDNWRALLLFQAAAKEAGEGTLRLKALGFVPTYGPAAYEYIRDDLFAGAQASQAVPLYRQQILQICAAWCVEARWGDRPGAIAALNLLLANEQDKICRDTITLALLEISLYPPQGGFSAAGPGVQAGRLLARQQAVQELLDFRRDGARTIRAAEEEKGARPGGLSILGAWPNPFNPVTTVEFNLPGDGPTRLGLYNLLGQLVAEPLRQPLSAGLHRVRVDGGTLSSGVYLAVLEQGGQHQVHKLLLVK
ncbi:MAG: T9SS type A sorting domain-containing protein [bacterium]|nr:T9SS type A sorting domain-containing protein [bacterium]